MKKKLDRWELLNQQHISCQNTFCGDCSVVTSNCVLQLDAITCCSFMPRCVLAYSPMMVKQVIIAPLYMPDMTTRAMDCKIVSYIHD